MELTRIVLDKLIRWSQRPNRKPLLLQGARQTGKTWLMQALGKTFKYTAYFDFASQPELQKVFEQTRDPKVILNGLRLFSDVPIEAGNTLIIFDEIQLCDMAFGSLKYFAQNAPEYAIVAGGSLLGVEVKRKNIFVPVGQIDIIRVMPLSFSEFLLNSNSKLFDVLNSLEDIKPLESYITPLIEREYLRYLCVGGMPAAVSALLDGESISRVDEILENILALYRLDFSQYATPTESMRISSVWDAIPGQLAKKNSRFFFSQVAKGARGREYAPAIQWLCDAGLVMRVNKISTPNMPLAAYLEPDFFKVYATDIGLLRRMAKLPAEVILNKGDNFKEFKGALTGNYVAISLIEQLSFEPSYWTSGSTAEVDFILQHRENIFPLAVKAGENLAGKSLSVYQSKYDPKLALRLSMKNLLLNGKILNIPLPLADWSLKLAELAVKQSVSD